MTDADRCTNTIKKVSFLFIYFFFFGATISAYSDSVGAFGVSVDAFGIAVGAFAFVITIGVVFENFIFLKTGPQV